MSADSYAICPRCYNAAKDRIKAERARTLELYGKISVDQFEKRRKLYASDANPEDFRTFREDYEFYGAFEGEVHASYKGRCSECGTECEIKTSKVFWSPDA